MFVVIYISEKPHKSIQNYTVNKASITATSTHSIMYIYIMSRFSKDYKKIHIIICNEHKSFSAKIVEILFVTSLILYTDAFVATYSFRCDKPIELNGQTVGVFFKKPSKNNGK